jgi:hypothetical protein
METPEVSEGSEKTTVVTVADVTFSLEGLQFIFA